MDMPVFFWCRNFGFGDGQAAALGWEQRMVLLREAVQSIADQVKPPQEPVRREGPGLEPHAIFLAPEYLFRPMVLNGNAIRAEAYSDEVKHRILLALRELSSRFPRILIFAGTVVWKKDLALTGGSFDDGAMFYDTVSDFSEFKEVAEGRRKKYAQRIKTWANQRPLKDRKFYRDGFQVANVEGWNRSQTLAEKQQALLAGTVEHVVKNTGFAFLNGQMVLKYSKQNDFHEVRQDDTLQFVPGSKCPTIQVWGRTLAMMICADYNHRDIKCYSGANANIWVIMSDVLQVRELPPTGTKSGFAALLAVSGVADYCAMRVRAKNQVGDVALNKVGKDLLAGTLVLP